jgi:NADH-quinone oxidoreductase subunit L
MATPHAEVVVDDTTVRATGEVKLSAAPGYGYSFKWEGLGAADSKLSERSAVTVRLQPGEKKDVTVKVTNAFGRETARTVSVVRPGLPPGARPADAPKMPDAPRAPGMVRPDIPTGEIPGDDIHKLLMPRGADKPADKGANQ